MSSSQTGLFGGKAGEIFKDGIYKTNPVTHQVLGICIFLAVTNKLANSLVMGAALIFVLAMSNFFVSILRNFIPRRIRMIAEVAIISTFVILLDQFLKGFYWDMSKQLGPYVALIITNCQVLGICIFLAVTNKLANSLVMGAALIFVLAMSNFFVSILRNFIPRRIRMIAEVAIISTFVILLDQFLKGFYWDMSKQLGPYVALIITNCIVMGRAEAYAMQNPPLPSMLDGVANGIGYAIILILIGLFRELIGSGTILGFTVLSESWYVGNLIFVLAPGAFFAAGFLIWIVDSINPPVTEGESG